MVTGSLASGEGQNRGVLMSLYLLVRAAAELVADTLALQRKLLDRHRFIDG